MLTETGAQGRGAGKAGLSGIAVFRDRAVFLMAMLMILWPALVFATADPAREDGRSAVASPEAPSANLPDLTGQTTSLVISISVNKTARGDVFGERDALGTVFLRVEDLLSLKLQSSQASVVLINGERHAPVSALQEVTYTFDEKRLALSVLGRTTESQRTTIDLLPLGKRPANLYYPREQSAFINYGLNYGYTDPLGSSTYSLSNRLGVRRGDLFMVSDSLYTRTDAGEQLVRLQSSVVYERRNDLQWLTVGDQFATSGTLGSTVNLAGIGLSKLYRLDPYFITQPVFDVKGVSKLPSEADIYLDGVLVSKQTIAPGQFDLANIYSYAGSHRVEIVLKDAFGKEQRIAYPFYSSAQMLRQGLHEYSYNVGFLRQQYGTASNDYGKPVVSAFHRYGVTSALNIGAQGEATDGVANSGVTAALAIPKAGAFSLSVAASAASGLLGTAVSFAHSYQQGSFNTHLLFQGYSRDYTTVASAASALGRYAASFSLGFPLGTIGNLTLGCSTSERYDGTASRGVSAGFSRQLSKVIGLFATTSTTRVNDTNNYAIYVGLNFTFGDKLHGTSSVSKNDDANVEVLQLQQDVPLGEGLGYRLYTTRTENASAAAYGLSPRVQYNGPYGIYAADANLQTSNQGKANDTYNLSTAGGLVYAGGFVAASRPVNDSFGIVTVDQVPDVTVFNNGQKIGTTNASGRIVVPNLTSYGQNQITLDVKNLPLNYSLSGLNRMISPPIWSGACVSFDAVRIQAVTGRVSLRREEGSVPLEYAEMVMAVGNREVRFPTGKGGEFYVENVLSAGAGKEADENLSCRSIAEAKKAGYSRIEPGTYYAQGEVDGRRCRIAIVFPATDEVISDLGEVQCETP